MVEPFENRKAGPAGTASIVSASLLIGAPRSPSMSMAVKPHQDFFLAARTDHAAGLVPTFARLPALSPEPSFPAAARPAPRDERRRGKKARSVTRAARGVTPRRPQ